MHSITPSETQLEVHQTQRLRRCIRQLINRHLASSINLHWLISFHYSEGKTQEAEVLGDTQALKRKLHRLIYQARNKSIKGAGAYPYPKLLFFHEVSHQGTAQYHTHLIVEAFPPSINTQAAVEHLFSKTLPQKVKALSKWKSIDIQRIHPDPADYKRISNYQSKQSTPEHLSLDPFSSDLLSTTQRTDNRPRDAQ